MYISSAYLDTEENQGKIKEQSILFTGRVESIVSMTASELLYRSMKQKNLRQRSGFYFEEFINTTIKAQTGDTIFFFLKPRSNERH
jgi:UDP-galactopyranose mutase